MLAFDTATPAVTVALYDGARVLAEMTTVDARRQGEVLATSIETVLARAHAHQAVEAVAVGVGPGPYTGLRAGLVTAHVLASAWDVPVHGVCTLDVIAAQAAAGTAGERDFLVATDARRREVYWARYTGAGERVSGPDVAAPAGVPAGLPAAGEGPYLHPGLTGELIGPRYPSAATLAALVAARLAAGLPLLPARPLYLRRPDARVPGPPKRVTPRAADGARQERVSRP